MRVLKAGVAYFLLVFACGFLFGMVRVPWLVPRYGVRIAELLETPFMLLAIVLAARFVARRFALPPHAHIRLAVGALAFVLMMATEVSAAVLLRGQTVVEYVAARDPVSGSAYFALLGVFALMPWLLVQLPRAGRQAR